MENASRALIIAGGIFIAMMLVGLLLISRTNWAEYQDAQEQVVKQEQTTEFNRKYEAYNKKVLTGFQMISLANMVDDYNNSVKDSGYKDIELSVKWYGLSDDPYSRPVDLDITDQLNTIKNDLDKDKKLKEFKQKYYTCIEIEYDQANARVIKMTYEEIKRK